MVASMITIPYPGGQRASPIAIEVGEPHLRELMALDIEHGGDLQRDQVLQATCGQIGNQFPGAVAIQ